MIADAPISCVAKGTGMSLESLEKYESALMTTSKNSY
jgi:actin-like ATPase involved in cell morphogenesis